MRYAISVFIIIFILCAGCSSSSKLTTQPASPDIPISDSSDLQFEALYQGSFEIDLETQSIIQSQRQSDLVYNITGFLPDKCPGGCFRFSIVNVVGTVLEIELLIENPLAIQVYDLTIQYIDLFGKTVLNADSYTDFLGTPISTLYPFTAFAKENPDRAFPTGPGGIDTETLFLDFPPGALSAVNYAITASVPGQVGQPYEISDMNQSGSLTPAGGNATISCKVDDHQDDVTAVYMNATPFTGGPVQLLPDTGNRGYYKVDISNTQGAPVGSYNQLIMALSPNSQNISTYNYVGITVSSGGVMDPIAIIVTIPDPPVISITNSIINLDGSNSYDPDGGPITLYEWDFDWDGVPANFNPDLSGMDMVFDYDYGCDPGIYTCGLRVTDDDSPPGVSEIASVDINLIDDFIPGNWVGPVFLGEEKISGDHLYMTGQSLQVDSDGWTHIITYNYDDIFHRSYKDGSMSDIDVVIGTPDSFRMVTSAIDNHDTLHVVWLTGYPDTTVQHTSMVGGVFTGIIDDLYTETQPGYRSEMMNIQRNDSGHIMATLINYDADKTDVNFMYTINTGAGFSMVTEIPYQIHIRRSTDPNPSYTNVAPNLVATPNGNFHQIFYSNEADLNYNIRIHDLVFEGTAWDPPRVAYDHPTSNGTMYDISVCSGPDGDVHITGQHEVGHMMHYVRYDAFTDTWLDDMAVADDSDSGFSYGAVEVDDNNMVHMAYTGSDGYAHLKVFCECSDEATILATPSHIIDSTTVNNEHNHIDLNWSLDGDLMAIYQDTRSSPVYLYFNVFSYN